MRVDRHVKAAARHERLPLSLLGGKARVRCQGQGLGLGFGFGFRLTVKVEAGAGLGGRVGEGLDCWTGGERMPAPCRP